MKALLIVTLALCAFAAFGIALALLWVAYYAVAHARDRRKHCPPSRLIPGLPVDGDPLEGDELRSLASVLLGYMASPDDDRSDERETQL